MALSRLPRRQRASTTATALLFVLILFSNRSLGRSASIVDKDGKSVGSISQGSSDAPSWRRLGKKTKEEGEGEDDAPFSTAPLDVRPGGAFDKQRWQAGQEDARIAYGILVSGGNEVHHALRLLRLIYTRDNLYVIHIDGKTHKRYRKRLWRLCKDLSAAAGDPPPDNCLFCDPPTMVSWGAFSVVLAALHALGLAVRAAHPWDYWINLSGSDMPLMTQREAARVLGAHRHSNVSFVRGAPYLPDFNQRQGHMNPNRLEFLFDDEGLFRQWKLGEGFEREPDLPIVGPPPVAAAEGGGSSTEAMAVRSDGTIPERQMWREEPELFRVYKGHFWVVLHRSFAEYIEYSPDNVARVVLNYISGTQIPDESFFQTVACHPDRPASMPVRNLHLRSIFPFFGSHPVQATPMLAAEALASGKLFGRKFESRTPEGLLVVEGIEAELRRAEAEAAADGDVAAGSSARVRQALALVARKPPMCARDREALEAARGKAPEKREGMGTAAAAGAAAAAPPPLEKGVAAADDGATAAGATAERPAMDTGVIAVGVAVAGAGEAADAGEATDANEVASVEA